MVGKIASRPLIIAAGTAMALSSIGGYAWHEMHRPRVLEIYVLDLPGGPAIFLRTPNDRRILINGGASAAVVRQLTQILPFYSRRIDTVIATDADGQNVTGLIEVLNRYAVNEVVIPEITLESLGLASSTDPIYRVFIETIDNHHIPTKKVLAGHMLTLDTNGTNDVRAGIIFPVLADGFKYSKASGPEILMRIDYGSTSVALMGNASTKVQKFIADQSMMPADILIVSHSIVPSNISAELINALAPDFLVYSQTIVKSSSKSSGKATDQKKKDQVDPLAGILGDHRFNIRKTGMVKIVSDGVQVTVN